ncbi:TRAP transporter small permease subunit [Marinobacterium lutimaris]|uniref:TRAP transporter small permease protein n=1 Tax=Marinobacterium lutimaris TaxID=568106 RepID=A0A1H5V1G3_9GAMM|nr:TRAP transporter small permease subunit [Marinobacterium lutimaris]SEF81054.1 TRAP-type mannitol/chloroaromatic compound transport system, small permease component [Marinobacterium lutimaris]
MLSVTRKIRDLCSLPAYISGWLIFPLIIIICVGVLGAKFGINQLFDWDNEIFLLGDALTLNSLLDFQWCIFALVVLFGGVCSYIDNQHVKVDLFSNGFSLKKKAVVGLLGDLFFLTPFLLIIVFYGSKFAYTSFLSGEGSTYGGLQDRWVIKACLPLSASIFMIAVLTRVIDRFFELFAKPNGSVGGVSNDD